MRCITIKNKYEYLTDFNTIINKELREIIPDNFFEKNLKTKTIGLNPNFLKDAFERLPHITFEVTQRYNLGCRYCLNNNNYFFERRFSEQSMKFEIAKKGLNFFSSKIKGIFTLQIRYAVTIHTRGNGMNIWIDVARSRPVDR